jgi:CRISPR-associated protein Csb2
MRWLSIEARLLGERYHGCGEEGRRSEWPPNPHRLFQALVAAGHLGFRRTEFSDAKKDALRWLEQRPAPEVVASDAPEGAPLRLYVPNNDMDKVARAWARSVEPEKSPSELRTAKDLRARVVGPNSAVQFLWSVEDEDWAQSHAHAELLCEEARHLHSLGLGIDLVAGNGRILSDADKRALGGTVYVPDLDGMGWRTPTAGSLDELLRRHVTSLQGRVRVESGRGGQRWVAPPEPPAMCQEVAYVPRTTSRERPVHHFALVDEDGAFRSFDPREAMVVAAWLRHAAHMRAQGLKLQAEFIEGFVCGHVGEPARQGGRFSYVPLPTIPVKGHDGRIRRVLVVEPFGGGGARALAVARRLDGSSLVDEVHGDIKADLRSLPGSRRDAVTDRYLRRSRRWGSVTPMVLPGHDDRRSRKAYGLVLKALAQAGYTTPVTEIHLQVEPVFPGADLAQRYRVPAYLKGLPRAHAIIEFTEPVVGPIAIGGGRHIGLGVFAALEEDRATSGQRQPA